MNEEILNEFKKLFKQHLSNNKQAQLRLVTCKSVDWDSKIMTAIGVGDNLEYYDVSLGLGFITIKPKIKADCIIGLLEGEESVAFLIDASEVEEIIYNEGKNGGSCNVPELKKQLEKLSKRVDDIISAINNAVPAAGASDGGSGLIGSLKGFVNAIIDKEDFNDIEDDKIKH